MTGVQTCALPIWPKTQFKVTRVKDSQPVTVSVKGEIVQFPTQVGERYRLEST